MSGADKIIEKIIQDAEEKAVGYIRSAEERAARIIADTEQEARINLENRLQKAYSEAENLKARIISIDELESRKTKLTVKQKVLSRAFELALERLADMPDNRYRQMIVEMILPLVEEGTQEITLSGRDKKRLDGIDDDINRRLSECGKKGSVSISADEGTFLGGFILKRGKIEVNCTLETLVNTRKSELEKEVADILFD
jgi:V/A-type H+-transporting ATPase subunit E